MRIGILTYRQYPYVSANTAIGYTLGETICKRYNYDVVFIGYKQSESQKDINKYHEIPIHFLNENIGREKHYSHIRNKLKSILGEEYFVKKEAEHLKAIVSRERIDVLISVIAPISSAFISYVAKLDIPVFLYQLDPFYNVGDVENEKLKRAFLKMLPSFNKIYTTDLLYKDYLKDSSIEKFREKMSIVQFPKIVEPASPKKNLEHEKIRLLYGGTLYRRIRNPKILLELYYKLSDKCEIVYLGKCDVEEDQELLEESGIICKGFCSQEELKEEIAEADILINIGNFVRNQLGSKLIEYIATGKPILNIYQFEECPTLDVLKKYPYKFNISVYDLYESKDKELEMIRFIREKKGKQENFPKIRELYQEYTPEHLAEVIVNDIKVIS